MFVMCDAGVDCGTIVLDIMFSEGRNMWTFEDVKTDDLFIYDN